MEKAQTIFGTGFNCTFMELKYTRTTAQKAALRL